MKKWCQAIIDGKIIANKYRVLAAKRFLKDLKNKKWEFKESKAAFVVSFIEKTFRLMKSIRAAIIYTSLFINIEENKKEHHSDKLGSIQLFTLNDDFKI